MKTSPRHSVPQGSHVNPSKIDGNFVRNKVRRQNISSQILNTVGIANTNVVDVLKTADSQIGPGFFNISIESSPHGYLRRPAILGENGNADDRWIIKATFATISLANDTPSDPVALRRGSRREIKWSTRGRPGRSE
jgi:hypothetical protein